MKGDRASSELASTFFKENGRRTEGKTSWLS
jgi:hypothetical protein